jgi:hypothetical protein
MALLLSCEKMSSLSNGVYLNGELIARMDGHISGWAAETSLGLDSQPHETLYCFGFVDVPSSKFVHIEACKNVWGSDFFVILIRDDRGTDWEAIGRGLSILKPGAGEEMTVRYYETPTGRTLEDVSVVRQVSGLLEIKEKKGTTTGKARVDVSFVLSNGDEYQIIYRGDVDTNHGTDLLQLLTSGIENRKGQG